MSDMKGLETLITRLRSQARNSAQLYDLGNRRDYDEAYAREEQTVEEIREAFRAASESVEEAVDTVGWCSVTDLKVGDTYRSGGADSGFEYTVLKSCNNRFVPGLAAHHVRVRRGNVKGPMTLGYFSDEKVYRTSCAF